MATRTLRKRKAEAVADPPPKRQQRRKPSAKTVEEQPDALPHNLGSISQSDEPIKSENEDAFVSLETANRPARGRKNAAKVKTEPDVKEVQADGAKFSTRRTLRPRRSAAGSSYVESDGESDEKESVKASKASKASKAFNRRSNVPKASVKKEEGSGDETGVKSTARKPTKKSKANPYGLTPGITPFPEWEAPSPADCEEVYRRLAKVHGESKAPKKIPAPSLDVSGCGEVPSVIDALIRTRLSANTSSSNSSAAFRGLVDKFGVVKEGIGKGSVNWDKVRLAPLEHIVAAIKCGGLAQIKGKDIKTILQMVHDENKQRRDAFIAEKEAGEAPDVLGAGEKTRGQKDLEIMKTDQNIVSLDHIHGMAPDEAMQTLIKFPGIGVKTASCVILFCLQQPSFAVDTHVHRLSRWLEWIPPTATRDEAFSHLEVRIPNHLKYGLHKLFVQHGKSCVRCRANTSEGSEEYNNAVCPLEGVINRVGKRQSSGKSKKKQVKYETEDSE